MALDATLARVATNGNVWFAPAGTTLPTDATTALDGAFADLGYLNEDGLTEAWEDSTTTFKAWQLSTTLREVRSDSILRVNFTMVEVENTAAQDLFYGSSRSTGTLTVTNAVSAEGVLVMETYDGSNKDRVVIPRAQLTARGEVPRNGNSLSQFPATLTVYPEASTDVMFRSYTATV